MKQKQLINMQIGYNNFFAIFCCKINEIFFTFFLEK